MHFFEPLKASLNFGLVEKLLKKVRLKFDNSSKIYCLAPLVLNEFLPVTTKIFFTFKIS